MSAGKNGCFTLNRVSADAINVVHGSAPYVSVLWVWPFMQPFLFLLLRAIQHGNGLYDTFRHRQGTLTGTDSVSMVRLDIDKLTGTNGR